MIETDEKSTFKAPRGERWNKLKLTVRAVYIVIAAHTDFKDNKCSSLSREKIAQLVGIKDVDDISKYTKQLEEAGFIKKTIKWVGADDKRCIYEVTVKDNYSLVKRSILKSGMTGKQIALFCTIASLRYKHSHRVKVSYKKCGISQKTYDKYIVELLGLGAIKFEGDYIIFKKYVKCEDYKTNEKLNEILNAGLDTSDRMYKMAVYAVEHPQSIDNIDAYIDYVYSGVKRH